jgi:hypothetical protein
MDDAGVVDVDDRGDVSLGPNADAVYQFLETSGDDDRSWPTYYAAHTGASAVALAAAWLFFEPFLAALFVLSLAVYAAIVGLHARSAGAE